MPQKSRPTVTILNRAMEDDIHELFQFGNLGSIRLNELFHCCCQPGSCASFVTQSRYPGTRIVSDYSIDFTVITDDGWWSLEGVCGIIEPLRSGQEIAKICNGLRCAVCDVVVNGLKRSIGVCNRKASSAPFCGRNVESNPTRGLWVGVTAPCQSSRWRHAHRLDRRGCVVQEQFANLVHGKDVTGETYSDRSVRILDSGLDISDRRCCAELNTISTSLARLKGERCGSIPRSDRGPLILSPC